MLGGGLYVGTEMRDYREETGTSLFLCLGVGLYVDDEMRDYRKETGTSPQFLDWVGHI